MFQEPEESDSLQNFAIIDETGEIKRPLHFAFTRCTIPPEEG
jgi:hypothetical protein